MLTLPEVLAIGDLEVPSVDATYNTYFANCSNHLMFEGSHHWLCKSRGRMLRESREAKKGCPATIDIFMFLISHF